MLKNFTGGAVNGYILQVCITDQGLKHLLKEIILAPHLQGPKRSGKSRQGALVFIFQSMPFSMTRLDFEGLLWPVFSGGSNP